MKIVPNNDGTETIRLAPWDLNGLSRDIESRPDEYQLVTEIQLTSPDEKSTPISSMGMSDLVDILNRTQCNRIQFIRIIFQSTFSRFDRINFPHLEWITFDNCHQHLELIAKFVAVSPNLRSLVECEVPQRNLIENDDKRAQQLAKCLGSITQALEINPRLTTFESPSSFEELRLTMSNPLIKTQYRTCLKQYQRLLPEALKRNFDAYQNYVSAMYQVLLIKKFRPTSVFRFINHDIVRLIVGLIKMSKWDRVWRP